MQQQHSEDEGEQESRQGKGSSASPHSCEEEEGHLQGGGDLGLNVYSQGERKQTADMWGSTCKRAKRDILRFY